MPLQQSKSAITNIFKWIIKLKLSIKYVLSAMLKCYAKSICMPTLTNKSQNFMIEQNFASGTL